jgi:hypothetical protein
VTRIGLYAAAVAALVVGVPFAGASTTDLPPAPTIISAPADPSGSSDASFVFSDPLLLATFQCQLDSHGFTPCTSPTNYSGLSDGSHTFDVKALDLLSTESAVTSYSWTIDTAPPPTPSITSGPRSVTNQTTATFVFSDSEPGVTFDCRLDKGAFPSCASPKTYTDLSAGQHAFFLKAVDAAGNESAAAPYTWTIDLVPPPTPTIDSTPPDPSGSSSAEFTFSDAEGDVSFECSLDGGSFSACSSPQNYALLADGGHVFAVRAVDPAGNASLPTTGYTWLIDTVRPVVTLNDKPPPLTNRTSATFGFSSNRSGSTFECRLGSAAFADCTTPVAYTELADGTHTFDVRAKLLGSAGPTTSYTWTVDTAAPETKIDGAPANPNSSTSATFAFTSSELGSTFFCSLDAGGFTPCTSPKTYEGLGDGDHTFRAQAVDAAGNADTTAASYAWRITGVGPSTADHIAPGDVKQLKRKVGYGLLKLGWVRPGDTDFDHVDVFVSTSPRAPARSIVYHGEASTYTDRHFKNGVYYNYVVVSYDHAGNGSRGASTVVPASALLRSPRDRAVVRKPPLLGWNAIPKATFYNAQLYYGTRKILSTWPRRPRVQLGRRWSFAGRRFGLNKGVYHWYVWPAFGPRTRSRYGHLLGQATFTVR